MAKNFEIKNCSFKALFENGDLRKLQAGDVELVQRIYFSVRDEEWLNVPFALKNFSHQISGDKISCSYEIVFSKLPIAFSVSIRLLIETDNIIIEANGKALSAFKKNRIGFCLHLPATLKAIDCTVTHTDQATTISSFPILISPHQPFKNISAIEWMKDGQKIKIILEGDVFEMEDQRNWTDASYKIYSTPLEIPFPVTVKNGESFHQKIVITLSGEKSFNQTDANNGEEESVINTVPCPAFGIFEPVPFNIDNKFFLHGKEVPLSFSHYRVDFLLQNESWREISVKGLQRASALNLPVYAVVYFGNNFIMQTKAFIGFIHSLKNISLHCICILSYENFVLPGSALNAVCAAMRESFPGVAVGAGTDANFAQINRDRPNTKLVDFISYAIQPQEHASDALSIIENIQGQADTVHTAKTFNGDKPVHISALSFYKRFNANTRFISDNKIQSYEYEGTNFEAAWFIASMHQLIVAEAACINFVYPVRAGIPFIEIFNYIAKNTPEYFYNCGSLSPEKYSVLSWQSKNKRHSVFANLTLEKIEVVHPYADYVLEPFEIYYTSSIIKNEK